jgi:MFS transporter, DHA2 family, multidrug resistance protein
MTESTTRLPTKPITASSPPRRWWALSALTLSVLTVALDAYVLLTALPTLSARLDASTSQLQWLTAGYTLASAALLLPAGKLADRFGRRAVLLIGLAVFGGASLIATRAGSANELIGARVLMGTGAAAIIPLVLAILPGLFPVPAERRRAVAVVTIGTMLGLPLGPLLAGWILTHFTWSTIFVINGPVAALSIIGVIAWVPESKDAGAPGLDLTSSLAGAAGIAGLVYAVIELPVSGWNAPVLVSLVAGAALLAGFAARQRTATAPLVDRRLFRDRGFVWGSAASAALVFAQTGMLFVLTPFLQVVQGNDAQATGLRVLPMIGALIAGAALSEKMLAPRLGARVLVPAGMLAAAAGLGVLTSLTPGSGYSVVAVALVVLGLGLGLGLPLAQDTILGSLPPGQTGIGAAVSRTLLQVGGVCGSAILGSVLNATYRRQMAGAPAAAGASVAGAHATRNPALAHVADQAYASGVSHAAIACIAVIVAAALASVLFPRPAGPGRS